MTAPDDTPAVTKVRRAAWQHRRELLGAAVLVAAGVWLTSTGPAAYLTVAAALAAGLVVPQSRRWIIGAPRRSHTHRLLVKGLEAVGNAVGSLRDVKPPKIRRLRTTTVGESVVLKCRPGQTSELLTNLSPILRGALNCRSVLVDRDADKGARIYLDIIRRDAFAAGQMVPWADQGAERLSLWDPIHVGIDESGRPVMLPLAYRGVIAGGVMDSGKSSLLTNIVAHAAMSPAHLVLIDPNEVQFGPWRHRALAYAGPDPAEAIAVLEALAAEMGRRLAVLHSLPGVVRKIDREVAEEHNLHPMLFSIDELAYHAATVGTPQQRQHIANLCRDIVSRGRAVLIIPVMATQRPTQDVVPRALVNLFPYQVAFRVRISGDSDVILGDSKAKQGFDASEISASTPGVAYLQAATGSTETTRRRRWWHVLLRLRAVDNRAGQDRPRRIKCCWIPDEVIDHLSVASLPYRPAPPPGWPVSIGPTIPASTVAA